MNVGYERVSSTSQSLLRQEYLLSGKVEKVFSEKASGKNTDRPQLKAMIEFVREGDVVIVESISRLARNTRDFLNILNQLEEKKVEFRSLKENIDTSTPSGRFMLQVFASLAELERETINERREQTIQAMKEAGTYKPGRPKLDFDEKKFKDVVKKWRNGEIQACEAYKEMGMKRPTFYKKVNELGL